MSEGLDYWIKQNAIPRIAFLLDDGSVGFSLYEGRQTISGQEYTKFLPATVISPDGKISHFTMLSVPKSKVLKVAPFEYRPESLLEDLMALKNEVRGK
jgi:hypothetical protein